MAIDTANKRFSMLNFSTVPTLPLFPPSGSINDGDRLHFLDLYSGLAITAPLEFRIYSSNVMVFNSGHDAVSLLVGQQSPVLVMGSDHTVVSE
jgi:hypothetical protein